MASRELWLRRAGLAVVLELGFGLLALHSIHALSGGEGFSTFLFGILLPVSFALALLVGAAWLWRREFDGANTLRVAGWCLIGSATLAVGGVLTILYQRAEGVILTEQLFYVGNAVSIGSVIGFVVGVYDVRQRTARERARQLSCRLTVLNRVLRHDIRNQANVIHGRAEILSVAAADDREHVKTIQRKALDLVELGDQARELEQLLRETDHERERLDIASVLDEQLARIEADYPDVDVRRSVPETAEVYAHPVVESAVRNVLENAIEHNPSSSRWLRVDCVPEDDAVEVRISDNGPGMCTDEVAVLERGYETPLDHTRGVGLWLVNWIVTGLDGDVWFEETSDGSTVCLQFQRCE